jgi:hypothetical protein
LPSPARNFWCAFITGLCGSDTFGPANSAIVAMPGMAWKPYSDMKRGQESR